MKNLKNIVYLISIGAFSLSCSSAPNGDGRVMYCGIETNEIELDLTNDNPYDFPMASEAYDAINDTIRRHMPDTVEFELFLAGMSKDAIAIYVYAPKSDLYMETIGCAIMNSDFPEFVPQQRYMLYYSYMDDPEATMPLEAMIKRK